MISGLDHVALVVEDLDAAIAGYVGLLGREPNWLGGDGGAHHAWFQLSNMALDVIAPHGDGAFGDRMRARLASHGEGFWAMTFRGDDIAAAQALANRRGMAASEISSTRSTHDDGRKRYWSGFHVDPADTAGVELMVIAPPRDGVAWPQSDFTAEQPAAVTGLDHIVIETAAPDRALALYGARLGLDLRLDRSNAQWGVRQMFFKTGGAVVEVVARLSAAASDAADRFGGLAWTVADAAAAQARMAASGIDVSPLRQGRKPGTSVFTVRAGVPAAPALIIQQSAGAA